MHRQTDIRQTNIYIDRQPFRQADRDICLTIYHEPIMDMKSPFKREYLKWRVPLKGWKIEWIPLERLTVKWYRLKQIRRSERYIIICKYLIDSPTRLTKIEAAVESCCTSLADIGFWIFLQLPNLLLCQLLALLMRPLRAEYVPYCVLDTIKPALSAWITLTATFDFLRQHLGLFIMLVTIRSDTAEL